MKAFYFGCRDQSGHYLYDSNGQELFMSPHDSGPFSAKRLDGGFCPTGHQDEGVAKLTHEAGFTVLAFWDRSVDKRPGSHSTFVFEGAMSFQEAVELASRYFPRITARYNFAIVEG